MLANMRPLLLSLCLVACGPGFDPTPDGGTDAGPSDGGAADSGMPDAGPTVLSVTLHYSYRDREGGQLATCHVGINMPVLWIESLAQNYYPACVASRTESWADIDCLKNCKEGPCVSPAFTPPGTCDWTPPMGATP